MLMNRSQNYPGAVYTYKEINYEVITNGTTTATTRSR